MPTLVIDEVDSERLGHGLCIVGEPRIDSNETPSDGVWPDGSEAVAVDLQRQPAGNRASKRRPVVSVSRLPASRLNVRPATRTSVDEAAAGLAISLDTRWRPRSRPPRQPPRAVCSRRSSSRMLARSNPRIRLERFGARAEQVGCRWNLDKLSIRATPLVAAIAPKRRFPPRRVGVWIAVESNRGLGCGVMVASHDRKLPCSLWRWKFGMPRAIEANTSCTTSGASDGATPDVLHQR